MKTGDIFSSKSYVFLPLLTMFISGEEFEFIPPPEAPVFEPDEEEWKDPLGYIAKIHPYAVKVGICKIRPPPDWQPPFSIDVDNFKFTPRIQKLNELEAKTRVKLNFIDAIAKFWDLQGNQIKLPNVEKKPLDIHTFHKIVQAEGGFEDVTRLRRWTRVAALMNYTAPATSGILRRHYEKILYPYDIFMSGAMIGGDTPTEKSTTPMSKQEMKQMKNDPEYKPNGDDDVMETSSIHTRLSRNKQLEDEGIEEDCKIDYTKNPELRKLQFSAPGPKIAGRRNKKVSDKYNAKDYETNLQKGGKNVNRFNFHSFIDDYKCRVCENGDDEDCMLLCDQCDASYHTFCLIPPLAGIPPGDWRCPKCVAKECNKPLETYGFEQAKKIYTLEDFSEMADKFKEDYFSMPPTEVPVRVVEKEFWKLVSSIDHDISVEYAADLHTADHGSGFPTEKNSGVFSDTSEYINSPWNLNNFPNNEKSVLKYITQDISGMKVPWIYVGMCFSSFCWHTEDHWSYSINFHHWGEPKTWYGVPQSEAERLESCVKEIAPELFERNPDLFHHLVTLCSPMTLMKHGVPVFRTNQYPGEFVVTFPRAYHAGFNTGYNCAEAVNFCPAEWLPSGQECVKHYQKMRRVTVFSHDELLFKMASIPDALELDLAKKLYDCMRDVVDAEIDARHRMSRLGIMDKQREAYELINDDERQCDYCKTTIFLSGVACACDKKRLTCLNHWDKPCGCGSSKKYIRFRYTLRELPKILADLKKRADSFDNWEIAVHKVLSKTDATKIEFTALKDYITEAEESQFPECELLDQLRVYVSEAEQCSQVANQLLTKKHKTRKTSTGPTPSSPRLTLNELRDFVNQIDNLPCIIKEAAAIDKLMAQVESFRYDAKLVLNSDDYNEKKVLELLEHAETMDVDLPEINDLRLDLKASKWLESIDEILNQEDPISLDVIRSCVDQGIGLRKKQASEKPLSRLKELLYAADRWEEKAKLCLQAKPRHMVGTLEVIVQEASKVKIILPNVSALKDALFKAKDWTSKVERVHNDQYYPYYDILEALVVKGRPIPVRLEQLPQMESQVAAARAWKDRTSRTFVKKASNKLLMELLQPRKDIGKFDKKPKKKKSIEKPVKTTADTKHTKKDKTLLSTSSTTSKKDEKSVLKDGKSKSKVKVKEEVIDSPSAGTDDDKIKEEGKRPIGIPVETINVDDYKAPDPLTVAQNLKDDEVIELAAMKELREKNKQKLFEENIEGPYCLCRKGIDGFMIRCNLCFNWYHTSCICPPKTVYGKPIGKGYNSWTATREVHYLCTQCCRSRRPRLDNILQLLMSLQKLPVRVPEGEALQFLTERAMNWQDRAKQALSNPEISRIITEAKAQVEKILAEKQLLSSANTNHNGTQMNIMFYQRLLQVKKVHIEKVTEVTSEEEKTKEAETKNEQKTSESAKTIPVENVTKDNETTTKELDAPSKASTDVPIEMASLAEPSISVSNATTSNDKDIIMKSPSKSNPTPTTPTTQTTTPLQQTPKKDKPTEMTNSGVGDELECTEEMSSGSPVSSSKTPNLSDPNVVRIQSASSSRAQSPIDVCTPLDNLATPKPAAPVPSTPLVLTMNQLENDVLDHLENLMFEGELLEVGLDEVQQIWAILQIQRPMLKEECNIMNADYRRKLVKDRKKQRKRKLEEAKAAQQAAALAAKQKHTAALAAASATKISLPSLTTKPANVPNKKIKLEEVKIKQEPMDEVMPPEVTKSPTTTTDGANLDESQDEDDCSARPCKKPLGDEVEWVQCDKCESWYHIICVGISAQDANNIEEYVCPFCCPPPPKPEKKPATKTTKEASKTGPTTSSPLKKSNIENTVKIESNKIPDLSVIAEVAHQIISGQEKANSQGVTPMEVDHPSVAPIPLPPPLPPSNLDLNSLAFLAEMSEKMDVTPIKEATSAVPLPTSTEMSEPVIKDSEKITSSPVKEQIPAPPAKQTSPNK